MKAGYSILLFLVWPRVFQRRFRQPAKVRDQASSPTPRGLTKPKPPYRFRSVDYPGAGAIGTEVYDFNGTTAVGYTADIAFIPFTCRGNTYQPLNIPGATGNIPYGINASGDIVGTYVNSSGQGHGFLYDGSQLTDIDVPGATATYLGMSTTPA